MTFVRDEKRGKKFFPATRRGEKNFSGESDSASGPHMLKGQEKKMATKEAKSEDESESGRGRVQKRRKFRHSPGDSTSSSSSSSSPSSLLDPARDNTHVEEKSHGLSLRDRHPCVFSTPLPDSCLHVCVSYLDVRSWFVLGLVSQYTNVWSKRDAQVDVVKREVLEHAARLALAQELEDYVIAEPGLAATRLREALQKSGGGVWSGGSLVRGLCGGSRGGLFSDEESAAWLDRDLDFFVPWSATFDGLRLCPVAAFFDTVCPHVPLPPYRVGPTSEWPNVCRYMTSEADMRSLRLHDSNGAYFTSPADDDARREWVPRYVLQAPMFPGVGARDTTELAEKGDTESDTDSDGEMRSRYIETKFDHVNVGAYGTAELLSTTKRHWRWASLDESRYRVPFIRARRVYRFPNKRSVDIVYVDLDAMRVQLAAQRSLPSPKESLPITVANWCSLTFDASILRNAYDGTRLLTCAYSCLRSRSFEMHEMSPIYDLLPPNPEIYHTQGIWGIHGYQTSGCTNHSWRSRVEDRRRKYLARGFSLQRFLPFQPFL
jgi:hypothetical protein